MGSNGTGGGDGGPCGACKFLRRKCVKNCVFAPYFDSEEGTRRFAAVHRVFGASNASKILLRVPPHRRLDAVVSMCYEALSRVRDPVYGCMSSIFALQRQIDNLQAELSNIHAQISILQHTHQPDDQLPSIDVFLSPTPMTNASTISLLHPDPTRPKQTMLSIPRCPSTDTLRNQESEENDLEMLARGFLASYAARMDE